MKHRFIIQSVTVSLYLLFAMCHTSKAGNYVGVDWRLSISSPLIDKGNTAYSQLLTDIEGNSRVNKIVDIGAYESQGVSHESFSLKDDIQFSISTCTDNIYIDQPATVCVYNHSGVLLLEANGATSLDISMLPSAIYFVKIVQGSTKKSVKLIKK